MHQYSIRIGRSNKAMEEINSPPTHKSQEQAQPGHSANQRREHQGEGRT